MSVFDKARELADAILASEESIRMADVMELAENGGASDNEVNKAINDYNALINEALDIVRMSIGVNKACGSCRDTHGGAQNCAERAPVTLPGTGACSGTCKGE